MAIDIISIIAQEYNLQRQQVSATVKLLEEGATIPFISRYRKEVTGSLDEVAIFNIQSRHNSLLELEKRKIYILETIEEQGKLTDELRQKISETIDLSVLEDLYVPFKPKRRTRAAIARERGLEPLAKIIMAQNSADITRQAARFVTDEVATADDAIAGAQDIIAEWVSENEKVRATVRNRYKQSAVISSSLVKGKEDEAQNYQNYFDFSEPLSRCSSHRYLAIRRGESEGLLRVSVSIDDEEMVDRLNRFMVKRTADAQSARLVADADKDGYKRLVKPSIETEVSAMSKEKADDVAISMFADNLRQLLFAPPLGHKRVMGIDPGYRTGCKVVCLDAQGNLLHTDVIYPCAPTNDFKGSARKISYLVEAYKVDAIAVGNGTASRETEKFLTSLRYPREVQVFVVSENGASIYSASKIAREEFPDKDVTVRGAVSIGRRLIDPLAELVKIDPKSIGVGQYQHDVDQNKLKDALDFTVMSCVNTVGVNVNTASRQLLSYVSGIGPQLAGNIVEYRAENGDFTSRRQLLKVPRMGEKAFQQCAGFLRIPDAENILDNTAVHPESYGVIENIARDNKCGVDVLIADKSLLKSIDLSRYVTDKVGLPTLNDIMTELEKPGRDPRSVVEVLQFDERVKTIDDLIPGMELNGIVNNITAFGAFVDVGIKQSGLVHISQLCDHYISSPLDVVKLHQHVKVKVLEVDNVRGRVSLTMKGLTK